MKKIGLLSLLVALVGSVFLYSSAHGETRDELQAMVLYEPGTTGYLDAFQDLKQSLIANMTVTSTPLSEWNHVNLSLYRVVYPDPSLLQDANRAEIVEKLMAYVKNGGFLYVEDAVREAFPAEFLGAREFRPVPGAPTAMEFPEVRLNLRGLQGVVKDFHDPPKKPLGAGMIPTTAETLAKSNGLSLFTVNRVGEGSVFFAASGKYLLRNEFAAYAALESTGFVVKKVLGTYGRPALAYHKKEGKQSIPYQEQMTPVSKPDLASARHDLPIRVFSPEPGGTEMEKTAKFVDKFCTDNDYNFMTEEQMSRTFHTVLGSHVELVPDTSSDARIYTLEVTPPEDSKWLGDYLKVLGVQVQLGERYANEGVTTDADIYMRRSNSIYFGVWQKATFTIGLPKHPLDPPHLVRANMPVEVKQSGQLVTLDWKSKGLQQVKFFAPNGLQVNSKGWKVRQDGGRVYILTRSGDPTVLQMRYL
ncbi:hypothetical protein JJB07_21735 [Tumebacillus sp. ITR2]|uniref:DUF4159 domain-containing protein n=1 Tax=Tumebacillus amylolyticus TaxID=2801339 RepID=A0ABS1JHK6_9BACL|nr:hypothetical protein [Tumebacillus amylolyticus]MBL0389218.1 hypothetical protein [Tumebacillus amylolyticus]